MQVADYVDPRSVACPRRLCGAQPGEPCRDRSGNVRSHFHAKRGREQLVHVAGTDPNFRHHLIPEGRGDCPGCLTDMARRPAVYRKRPRPEILCRDCADVAMVDYDVSRSWRELYGDDPYGDR